jgi:hypothetical protein
MTKEEALQVLEVATAAHTGPLADHQLLERCLTTVRQANIENPENARAVGYLADCCAKRVASKAVHEAQVIALRTVAADLLKPEDYAQLFGAQPVTSNPATPQARAKVGKAKRSKQAVQSAPRE